jgi:lipoprotein-anchoring transpeptidase ErfK/SrfK
MAFPWRATRAKDWTAMSPKMSRKSIFHAALMAGLALSAPQARAQLFWTPQPEQKPQQQGAHPQKLQQQRQVQPQAQQQPQQRQVQQQAQQQPQQQSWWWGEPQPQQVVRQRLPEGGASAVVDLGRNSGIDGGYRRPADSAVTSAVLPPDADPNYSTPVNLDPDVNYKLTARKEIVDPTGEPVGTITINTAKRKLYYSLGDGRAMEYGIAVGKQGFAWKGEAMVGRKSYWPGWTPPPEMIERRPELPDHMDGSLSNPLGARALYLFQNNKDTLFRIHGTNEPSSIGHAASSGCIRMHNADIIDLYGRVAKGARVVVM